MIFSENRYPLFRIMLYAATDGNVGSFGHAVVGGGFYRVPLLGRGSLDGTGILSLCGILRCPALSLLSQLRRAHQRGRLAGAAAVSATMLIRLRAPIESLHVPRRTLVQIGAHTPLKPRPLGP